MKVETNCIIKLPNDFIVKCAIFYKHVLISINRTIFRAVLIHFDVLDFDIIPMTNWLCTYGVKIYFKNSKIILSVEKGPEVCFHGQREAKPCPIISAMKAS